MISVLKLDHVPQVTVRYAETFSSEEPYKLLEIDEAILQELIENGLTIKGSPEDEAVLCTSKATYAMKFVSTSNTVLLVPPLNPSYLTDHVCETEEASKPEIGAVATASGHIELVETAPKLEMLRALVSQRPYRDDDWNMDEEEECTGQLYTWDALSARIQASDYQLREGLRKVEAAEIGNYWRVIDPDYMHNLLQILLSTAVQNDWSLKALPGSELLRRLEADSFSPQVVISCLEKFGIRTGALSKEDGPTRHDSAGAEGPGSSGTEFWALDDDKLCLHYARMLLAAKPVWKVEDFMEEWTAIAPSWTTPQLRMLRGEAIVDKIGLESWLHQFNSSLLPVRPDARFAALFSRRSKWEWEDLQPYLRDLKIPGQSVEALLLKYTRKSQPTPTSTPVYTAR